MSPHIKERTRLMTRAAQCIGLISTAAAIACLCLPTAVDFPIPFVPALLCLLLIAISFVRVGESHTLLWALIIAVASITNLLLIGLLSSQDNAANESVLLIVCGGCIGALALLWDRTLRSLIALGCAFAVAIASLVFSLLNLGAEPMREVLVSLVLWAFAGILSWRLSRIVPQTVRRIASMSHAYRAERQASETEALRRQNARLLHDTVLATLTLLAHSGVGVSEQALREQATEDAALLRQLRMGYTPEPAFSGDYTLKPVEESTLGNTLESVKQRFRRIGLEVNWHGSGQVLLPSNTLDAFLLALAECLENVRRHSGVDEAHVTITDDDETVRAMVTDAGIGFDLDSVGPGRLGFAESIVARLRDVGGNARLFSSPGSGTTVVLEVPK